MIEKGDILMCKKSIVDWSTYVKGNRYIVRNIVVNGETNVNIYIGEEEEGSFPTPFSLYKDYDKHKSYSKYVLDDYFVSLVHIREEKLKQLGL